MLLWFVCLQRKILLWGYSNLTLSSAVTNQTRLTHSQVYIITHVTTVDTVWEAVQYEQIWVVGYDFKFKPKTSQTAVTA